MDFLIIHDGQIMGRTTDPSSIAGSPWQAIANPFPNVASIDELTIVDGVVELRAEPEPFVPQEVETFIDPWIALKTELLESGIWAEIFQAGIRNVAAQGAWTLLLSAVTVEKDIQTLTFGLDRLIKANPAAFTETLRHDLLVTFEKVNLLTPEISALLRAI